MNSQLIPKLFTEIALRKLKHPNNPNIRVDKV